MLPTPNFTVRVGLGGRALTERVQGCYGIEVVGGFLPDVLRILGVSNDKYMA